MYHIRKRRLKRQAIRKFGKGAEDKIHQYIEDGIKEHKLKIKILKNAPRWL